MSLKTFFSKLLMTMVISVVFIFGMSFIPALQSFNSLGWTSILFFILWTLLMFFISRKAAQNENKNIFTNAILGFTFAKLFISAGIVYAYFKITEPESRFFLIPFFGVYLIYTIFETYFMMKLGKTQYAND
ncbi:MAG: hypothetical protein KDC85_08090 [Saprospiraceae bacterium]|nr:hypothetical protein [Saprospiraceae bacterium]MCB9324534.1 hypothetical protein [Lewinellaceae bacterium]